MEIDSGSTELESCKKREEILKSFATSISKLSSSSRGIPSEKDFHFFLNFDEFKIPVKEIEKKAEELLKKIGSSRLVWGKSLDFPEDPDDAFDWMVNANDEIFEKFDSVLDEIQRSTSSMDSQKHIGIIDEEGFQLVSGRKKKVTASKVEMSGDQSSSTSVKVASRDKKTNSKSSIPFHIPSIPRPQDQFKILVNNTNAPFEHVWLPKSEDGSRVVHPLENMSVLDFVDRNLGDAELTPPLPLESSPFKFVQKVDELKELAAKLQRVDEFAIDLEHNQYRSFQGLTCLMQISTRTEDYVVDTLKLRVHVGPYLREVFKNPFKRKVMHGADRDIIWLQRDFGIYVCNLFDTGQASRVLQLERNSLEHILHHFCGVHAKKEYQTADWRLRPLPEEMLMYAREDTHYLLHIYDQMRRLLLPGSGEFGQSDDLLLEVYKRSYDICMRLYEKEIHTDTSYLYIYGLQGAELNSQQLAVLAGLYHWRDCVARLEDESTGYILPNKTLIEIAKQMPITSNQLCRLVRSKHPYVEKNSGSLINIIKNSIANASTFEDVAEQLKKAKETTLEEDIKSEPQRNEDETLQLIPKNEPSNQRSDFLNHSQIDLPDKNVGTPNSTKVASVVSVSVSKKPNRAFGALLGSSVSKRKVDSVHEGILSDKDNAEMKVEQIKSSIVLPFHSFLSDSKPLKPVASEHVSFKETEPETCDGHIDNRGKLEEIIPLENASSDADSMSQDETTTPKNHSDLENGSTLCLSSESEKNDHPTSSSGLSSTFAKCLKSVNEERGIHEAEKRSPQTGNSIQLTPFDYASARRQRFGEREEKVKQVQDDNVTKYAKLNSRRMNANVPFGEKNGEKELNPGEKEKDFQQSRRCQAFPASGNRTATFR